MIAISKTDLRELVSMRQCIDLVKKAFIELYEDRANVPLRLGLDVETGRDVTLLMPAHVPEVHALGFKVVSVFRSNTERGLPVTNAMVCLMDDETGAPAAILNGSWLTALRTGAVSGASAELMSREDSHHLVVIGAGAQGVTQAAAVCEVRDITTITVVGRSENSFPTFRKSIEEDWPNLAGRLNFTTDAESAVQNADIICLATSSNTPVFEAGWVKPGTHVSGVGSFTPDMQEAPEDFVTKARIVVDMKEHALEEAGDLIMPLENGTLKEEDIVGELGGLALGEFPGRTCDAELTFFKSVGNAVQDMVVAAFALEKAREQGSGQEIDLG